MKEQKKSQITMIMIIGLVLFIVVSLVLYLSKSAVKKQSQQGIKKIHEAAIETQPVKEFVAKCLDKLAKDAVVLLGSQGGYIYKSQGGTLVDYKEGSSDTDEGLFFVKHSAHNVVYNILPPRFIHAPPIYPWIFFPYNSCSYSLGNCDNSGCSQNSCINVGQCSESSLSGDVPYISNQPTVICTTKGSTWENCGTYLKTTATCPASNQEIYEWYFGISNIPPLVPSQGPNSIQSQIEIFIDSSMPSCADFAFFEKQGLEIAMNSTKSSVVIGSNDISVNSKIPIRITNPATNEVAEISDFSTNLDVRMKEIYYFAKELIASDARDIRFNISDAGHERDSFKARLIKDVISKDDLIIITDQKSLVYGSQYQYVFARKNRIPALHYIKNADSLQFESGHNITQDELLQGLGQELRAEDPDEDALDITITPLPPCNKFPCTLIVPQQKFKVEVSDGILSDYQIVNVNRI